MYGFLPLHGRKIKYCTLLKRPGNYWDMYFVIYFGQAELTDAYEELMVGFFCVSVSGGNIFAL